MPIYYNKIVVLPLHRDQSQQDAAPIDQTYVQTVLQAIMQYHTITYRARQFQSYVIDGKKHNIKHIISVCWLYGYHDPTLCILHEVFPTWTGYGMVQYIFGCNPIPR